MGPEPGSSPFRTRGLVYLGAREYFTRRLQGNRTAIDLALNEPMRAFWSQIFVASGMYDVLPIVDLSAAVARLADVGHRELVIDTASWLASQHLNGVYRLLLKLSSARQVAARLPQLSMRYFDFGGSVVEELGASSMRAAQTGVPAPLVSWMTWVVEGFAKVVLRSAGARVVNIQIIGEARDGVVGGMETRTLRWQIQWR